jgi:CS domain/N-terminal conserved domain of Nudc.
MSSDDERFDGLYLNVAQTTRGIEPLLDTVFSFLRRKTDFFAGPPGLSDSNEGTQKAIDTAMAVVQKHADLYKQQQRKQKPKPAAATVKKAKTAAAESDVIEVGSDGKFDVSPPSSSPPSTSPEEKSASAESGKELASETPSKELSDAPHDNDDNATDEPKSPPPVGNGGTVPGRYVWTQTLAELLVTFPVPDHTRGRDVNVIIRKQHLKVVVHKDMVLVDAALHKPIIVDDSFWTLEDENRLVINLQKLNAMEWWDCVCQGDPNIDVKTIQPENSSLSTLVFVDSFAVLFVILYYYYFSCTHKSSSPFANFHR